MGSESTEPKPSSHPLPHVIGTGLQMEQKKHTGGAESGWDPLVGKDQQPHRTQERPESWNLIDLGPNPGHSPAVQLTDLSKPQIPYLYKGGLDLITGTRCQVKFWEQHGLWLRQIPETGKEKSPP